MADIKTQEQYDRTFMVYQRGITERGTKADREKIGDLTVAMTCPKGVPREPQLSDVRRLMMDKGFVIGHPERKKVTPRKKSKKELYAEAEALYKEAGGKPVEADAK